MKLVSTAATRTLGTLLLLLVTGGTVAGQADYTVIRTIFLPSVFYVGDRVEARITIRTRDNGRLTAPETAPEVPWADFETVRLVPREDGWDVRLVFRAYEPGTHTVPDVDLGAVTVSGVDIHVRSILGTGVRELAPPRPQLLLPSTRLMFGIAGGALVFLPLLWFTFVRWGRKKIAQLAAWYRRRQPYRRLSKSLKALRLGAVDTEGRVFYRELMVEMRRYLSDRIGRDCMSATTSELVSYLKPVVKRPESRRELVGVLRAGDLVKFAGRTSGPEERVRHVYLLERVAAEIESEQQREAVDVDR